MKTDDLVSLLVADMLPVAPQAGVWRLVATLALGMFMALIAMFAFLGPRPDILQATMQPMFWFKLAFPASLLMVSAVAVMRLGYPGIRVGHVWMGVVAPVAVIWLIAIGVLVKTEPGGRSALIWGATWIECPINIALLATPALLAAFWAMKQLAPTHLRLAGAAAGLFGGAVGAFVYALHCPEMEAPFLGVWYVMGILIPAVVGAMFGPRLLHW